MTKQGAEKLKELKRQRRVLKGATVTMMFDLLVLLTDEDRESTRRLAAMNAGIERARRKRG